MDDQAQDTNNVNVEEELLRLLDEVKKQRKESAASGNALIEKANRLASELSKMDLSIDKEERAALEDLKEAIAEEITSLKDDEAADR